MVNRLGFCFPFEMAAYINIKINTNININININVYTHTNTRKSELMENGNFHLFAANRKRKQQTPVCLLQTEMENGSLLSLDGKR
jgi:hypothetical protein